MLNVPLYVHLNIYVFSIYLDNLNPFPNSLLKILGTILGTIRHYLGTLKRKFVILLYPAFMLYLHI